jgi:hypothetical protein
MTQSWLMPASESRVPLSGWRYGVECCRQALQGAGKTEQTLNG